MASGAEPPDASDGAGADEAAGTDEIVGEADVAGAKMPRTKEVNAANGLAGVAAAEGEPSGAMVAIEAEAFGIVAANSNGMVVANDDAESVKRPVVGRRWFAADEVVASS
jgi:hypothetical protein